MHVMDRTFDRWRGYAGEFARWLTGRAASGAFRISLAALVANAFLLLAMHDAAAQRRPPPRPPDAPPQTAPPPPGPDAQGPGPTSNVRETVQADVSSRSVAVTSGF